MTSRVSVSVFSRLHWQKFKRNFFRHQIALGRCNNDYSIKNLKVHQTVVTEFFRTKSLVTLIFDCTYTAIIELELKNTALWRRYSAGLTWDINILKADKKQPRQSNIQNNESKKFPEINIPRANLPKLSIG